MKKKLPADVQPGACPDCGLYYAHGYSPDESYHRKVHDEAINGAQTKLTNGLHTVTNKSPMSLQRSAHAAARAARRETENDFPSFEPSKNHVDEFNTIAIVYAKAGRVVGLLVSRERECICSADLDSFRSGTFGLWRPNKITKVKPQRRRTIDMISVLKSCRKQGIATKMANALATHCNITLGNLAHMTPFREDAVRLWRALGLRILYLV